MTATEAITCTLAKMHTQQPIHTHTHSLISQNGSRWMSIAVKFSFPCQTKHLRGDTGHHILTVSLNPMHIVSVWCCTLLILLENLRRLCWIELCFKGIRYFLKDIYSIAPLEGCCLGYSWERDSVCASIARTDIMRVCVEVSSICLSIRVQIWLVQMIKYTEIMETWSTLDILPYHVTYEW